MKTKLRSRLVRSLVLSAALGTLMACSAATPGGTSTDSSELVPTDGSQNKSQLAGNYSSCEVLGSGAGTSLNGLAYTRSLALSSDGTYTIVNDLTGGTTCTNGHASGTAPGTVYMQVNASGSWTVGGTNTTPSTSTKIALTQTSQIVTIYTPTSGSNTASDLTTWANACTGWSGSFTSSSRSQSNFFPNACPMSGNVVLGIPPAINVPNYNVGYYNSTTHFQTGALLNVFNMNAGTYPTSYSVTWN